MRFREGRKDSLGEVEVEGPRNVNLLPIVREVLFRLRIQVAQYSSWCDALRLRHTFGVAEFDGSPVLEARRAEVQAALIDRVGAYLHDDGARRSAG